MKVTKKIIEWAEDRGILDNAAPKAQMLKTVEEVGELAHALGKRDIDAIADAIGDIAVTLIIQAELHDLDFEECLQDAYNIINKRSGKMVNGIFVKDE